MWKRAVLVLLFTAPKRASQAPSRSAGGGKGLRHAYGHQPDFHDLAVINASMAHLRLVLVKHVNREQRFRPGLKLHEWESELPESQIADLDLWSFACDPELLLDLRLH